MSLPDGLSNMDYWPSLQGDDSVKYLWALVFESIDSLLGVFFGSVRFFGLFL
jgi:hypothetical protein